MRVAIMQPYFLPYIGYFQLIAAVDTFVVYDNVKYTKRGWINRNRMLVNGTDAVFSLPLKNASNSLNIVQRELSTEFNRTKLLNQFKGAYVYAPYFARTFPSIECIVRCDDNNLFRFIYHSLVETCAYLSITNEIRISSEIVIDHSLKAQDKVLALCQALGADTYVNLMGGKELYDHDVFRARGIELKFLRSKPLEYAQFGAPFVPSLSILDVMMFNTPEQIGDAIREGYELV